MKDAETAVVKAETDLSLCHDEGEKLRKMMTDS